MRSWWELYKKELQSIGFFAAVILLLVLGWQLFLLYKTAAWPSGLAFGLSFIPYSLFPLLVLWLGYNSFRKEWKDDTVYFLLSLPRPGWQLSIAKLLAGMTFYTVTIVFTTGLIYLTQQAFIQMGLAELPGQGMHSTGWINTAVIKVLFFYWLSGLVIYILGQFSQLVSQFYDRFRGLISIVVFILSSYLVYRVGGLLAPLFNWVPDFPVRIVNETLHGFSEMTIYLGTGPLVGSALIVIAMFLTGSWMLASQLEV